MAYNGNLDYATYYSLNEVPDSTKINEIVTSLRQLVEALQTHGHSAVGNDGIQILAAAVADNCIGNNQLETDAASLGKMTSSKIFESGANIGVAANFSTTNGFVLAGGAGGYIKSNTYIEATSYFKVGVTSPTHDNNKISLTSGSAPSGDLYWGNRVLVDSSNKATYVITAVTAADTTITASGGPGAVTVQVKLDNNFTWTGVHVFSTKLQIPTAVPADPVNGMIWMV